MYICSKGKYPKLVYTHFGVVCKPDPCFVFEAVLLKKDCGDFKNPPIIYWVLDSTVEVGP